MSGDETRHRWPEWHYSRSEILADGAVHFLGVLFGLVAVTTLVVLARGMAGPWQLTAILIYGVGLLAVLFISAAYNLWPVSWTRARGYQGHRQKGRRSGCSRSSRYPIVELTRPTCRCAASARGPQLR